MTAMGRYGDLTLRPRFHAAEFWPCSSNFSFLPYLAVGDRWYPPCGASHVGNPSVADQCAGVHAVHNVQAQCGSPPVFDNQVPSYLNVLSHIHDATGAQNGTTVPPVWACPPPSIFDALPGTLNSFIPMPPRVVNPAPDAHTPVGRPPFLPPHPVVRPAGSAATVRCCFGAVPCGKEFRTTASAIKRHLKKYHFGGDECWQDKARAQCAWLCGTEECSLEMDCGSLGSHIASVHLRSTRRMCRYCMRSFSRSDSLARHLPKCRARRSDGDVEIRAM